MKIAVIGGSISGCMVAAMLDKAGHDVSVFERSANDLVGRGGGIATSTPVVNALKQSGLVSATFPTVPHQWLKLGVKTDDEPVLGRCPWGPELQMECVHWSGLFGELKQHLGNARYRLGKELLTVEYEGEEPVLHFSDGSVESAQLVVFTDGFRSLGRRMMHPEVQLDYRGMVIWRGVLDEQLYSVGDALEEHPRLSFKSMPGSFITYFMPSLSGSTRPGERVINWAAYLPVAENELPAMMVDCNGRQREGTVPAGFFPLQRENALKALMHEQLPSLYADIIDASVDTQYQPLRTAFSPSHYDRRLCLVGDAAVAIQPLTGSGAFKAYENARTLVEALASEEELETALTAWSIGQTRMEQGLRETGYAMEQAFLWNTIDLATASVEEIQRWWADMLDGPKAYSYLKAVS